MPRTRNQIADCQSILKNSESNYRNLFNNAAVAMFQSKIDGTEVLDVNNKFCELFGVSREETIGKPAVNFWAEPREREEMIRRLKREGKVLDFECRLLGKDGKILTCLNSVIPYPDLETLEGSLVDITEREQAKKEIEHRNRELETMNRLMVDRELKMIELKKENEKLKKKLGLV